MRQVVQARGRVWRLGCEPSSRHCSVPLHTLLAAEYSSDQQSLTHPSDSLVVFPTPLLPKQNYFSSSAFSEHYRKRSTATFKYCVTIVLCIRLQSSQLLIYLCVSKAGHLRSI